MINTVKINGFKSIYSEEIELGQVNFFIGANGSGKSNILESLGVISAAAYGRVDDESLICRGVRPGVPRLRKLGLLLRSMANMILIYYRTLNVKKIMLFIVIYIQNQQVSE